MKTFQDFLHLMDFNGVCNRDRVVQHHCSECTGRWRRKKKLDDVLMKSKVQCLFQKSEKQRYSKRVHLIFTVKIQKVSKKINKNKINCSKLNAHSNFWLCQKFDPKVTQATPNKLTLPTSYNTERPS